MIGKERIVGVLGPALIVAFIIGGLPVQLFAPTAEPQLVSYVVTWHVTARGSGHRTWPSGETEAGLTHFSEMRGAAIVRFEPARDNPSVLRSYDTRYLSVSAVDSWQGWGVSHWQMGAKPGPSFECPSCVEVKPHICTESTYTSTDITEPSENSGLYVRMPDTSNQLLGDWDRRPDGGVIFREAFFALNHLQFTHGYINSSATSGASDCGPAERKDSSYKGPASAGALLRWGPRAMDEKYDLQAVNAKDDSFFAINVRFSEIMNPPAGGFSDSVAITDQVEWTAEAHRLGKCPCALNPINAALPPSGLAWAAPLPSQGKPPQSQCTPSPNWVCFDDSALKKGQAKEVVDVWPLDHEMDANGSGHGGEAKIKGMGVNVKITTCDGIPVKGETVQITVDPIKDSGGHKHDESHRPGGMLNDKEIDKPQPESFVCPNDCIEVTTDEKGYAYGASYSDVPAGTIRFQPPDVGQAKARYGVYRIGVAGVYQITARSKQFPNSKASDTMKAFVKGIKTMPPDDNYELVRKGTGTHPEGFFATEGTRDAFKKLGADFLQAQKDNNNHLAKCNKNIWHVQNPVLAITYKASINDIALPMGGIFDLGPPNGGQWWRPPYHQTHNKGEGGDFNRFLSPELMTGNPPHEVVATMCDTDCKHPPGGACIVPVRSALLFLLMEYGKPPFCTRCKWDCRDLGMPGNQDCEEGETGEAFPITGSKTLHLHVQD